MMELIVAVYDDWGIGCCGTQPIALSADRRFFRQTTRGSMVIVGRKTAEDFPEQKPLPGRVNVMLTQSGKAYPGFRVCKSVEEAVELASTAPRAFVIGGAGVYQQMLPYCDRAYVTVVHCAPKCDSFFPNLDETGQWRWELLQSGAENGIAYEMRLYTRL